MPITSTTVKRRINLRIAIPYTEPLQFIEKNEEVTLIGSRIDEHFSSGIVVIIVRENGDILDLDSHFLGVIHGNPWSFFY